jgi:hypothetical protein
LHLFQEECTILLDGSYFAGNVKIISENLIAEEMRMKKLIVAVLLGLVLCSAGAFADHPKGWGVGIVGQYGGAWTGGGGLGGAALSLKAPALPVFWGISLSFPSNGFGFGVTGDYYLIDQTLVKDIGLGWFFGIGGYLDFVTYSYTFVNTKYSQTGFGLGVRVPIGLSLQPIDLLEVFFDFAPSLGLLFYGGDYYDYYDNEGKVVFGGGWQGDVGIRFWF